MILIKNLLKKVFRFKTIDNIFKGFIYFESLETILI
jgi:hypothetical protein